MDKQLIPTKEGLVLSTIEILNQFGLQGLTTREIAKTQGVSESTIFKHYKTKNDLIVAVLNHFSQYDEAIIDSVKKRNLNPIPAITFFVNSYVTYYENYPEITAIINSYEGLLREPELGAIVKNIFHNRRNFIKDMIEAGKRTGEIQNRFDSDYLTDIITGLERVIILKWRMDNYGFSLKENTMSALKMVLDAFSQ